MTNRYGLASASAVFWVDNILFINYGLQIEDFLIKLCNNCYTLQILSGLELNYHVSRYARPDKIKA